MVTKTMRVLPNQSHHPVVAEVIGVLAWMTIQSEIVAPAVEVSRAAVVGSAMTVVLAGMVDM